MKGVVAYYTISTGIGGARIVDGVIDRHVVGFEPGKQIIDHTNLTSIESHISGHGIQNESGKEPRTIVDKNFWIQIAHSLAIALFNSIVHWSPDVFVLGGPMIVNKPGIDIKDVEAALFKLLVHFPIKPTLKLAELHDEAGLYGALEYIREQRV